MRSRWRSTIGPYMEGEDDGWRGRRREGVAFLRQAAQWKSG